MRVIIIMLYISHGLLAKAVSGSLAGGRASAKAFFGLGGGRRLRVEHENPLQQRNGARSVAICDE